MSIKGKTRKPKACTTCGRAVTNSFVCRRCARELQELLVGDGSTELYTPDEHPQTQPGIVWYIQRLRESAYRQTRMERSLGARSSASGYYLFGDQRAIKLLARISASLARWDMALGRLSGPQSAEISTESVAALQRGSDGLDVWRARHISDHLNLMRHRCADLDRLHGDMLAFAKEAWGIINRPDDMCCGPCPNPVDERDDNGILTGKQIPCGVILYAEEYETDDGKRRAADTVQCPKCRVKHDVSKLREGMKSQVADMLFTGPELLKLMETRLNDRMPKATFYLLIRDGRLRSRDIDQHGQQRYTYNDVVAAREKPVPQRRKGR